ncbi:hypothetical protein M1615_04525 [Patescibacteria group bacterium]|nr:hypothetical protein [Patescibacteria group bacterium]
MSYLERYVFARNPDATPPLLKSVKELMGQVKKIASDKPGLFLKIFKEPILLANLEKTFGSLLRPGRKICSDLGMSGAETELYINAIAARILGNKFFSGLSSEEFDITVRPFEEELQSIKGKMINDIKELDPAADRTALNAWLQHAIMLGLRAGTRLSLNPDIDPGNCADAFREDAEGIKALRPYNYAV